MQHALFIAVVLLLSFLCMRVTPQNNDVTYDDIVHLNATCPIRDSCKDHRVSDDMNVFNCQCGPQCVAFGTCCVDSMYRRPNGAGVGGFKCRRPYGSKKPVFMVDGCRRGVPVLALEKCLGGGNALEEPGILVPVTSSTTGRTYRNSYCYACNEDVESSSAVVWNLKLTSKYRIPERQSLPDLHYDETLRSWIISDSGEPVIVTMEPPSEIATLVQPCRISVIGTCAKSWTDPDTEAKCGAYTAMVSSITMAINRYPMSYLGTRYRNPHLGAVYRNSYQEMRYRSPNLGYPKSHLGSRYLSPGRGSEYQLSRRLKWYRNPHCAVCNFEDPSRLSCSNEDPGEGVGTFDVHNQLPKVPFFVGVFALVGQKCPKGMNWDKFAKKCRVVRCGRGKVLERDTCLPKRS